MSMFVFEDFFSLMFGLSALVIITEGLPRGSGSLVAVFFFPRKKQDTGCNEIDAIIHSCCLSRR